MHLIVTNDVHSHLVPDLLARLWAARAEGALVVDAGDFLEGAPLYTHFSGVPELGVLDQLYDVVTPGNHGFGAITNHDFAHATLLATNLPGVGVPYVLREGVGLLSILGLEAWSVTPVWERRGRTIVPPREALETWLPKLQGRCDQIVTLSHQGFVRDLELAKTFPEINLILAAHCHSDQYEARVGDVRILKAHEHAGSVLEVRGQTHTHHRPTRAQRLPDALDWLSPYLDASATRGAEGVGHAPWPIDRAKFLELVAAWRQAHHPGMSLLLHDTCFRRPIAAGTVTQADLDAALPFGSTLVRLHDPNVHTILTAHPLATHLHAWEAGSTWWVTDYVAAQLLGHTDHHVEIPLTDILLEALTP